VKYKGYPGIYEQILMYLNEKEIDGILPGELLKNQRV
jgi:hypothetical protein